MLKSKMLSVLIILILAITACSSNEIGESKDVTQDKIYQSYTISYTEGETNAAIFCQFRFAGNNGTTLVLNSPSQVQLDGEKLDADSSTGAGAYYSTHKTASDFFGKHSFAFINTNNKKYENDFLFDSFKLINVPAVISKKQEGNIYFETTRLQGDDVIELEAGNTDSSFNVTHHAGAGNFITIPLKELQRQKVNELTLETTLYRKIPLQQNTAEGGVMEIRYTLKPVKIKLEN
jgi:hypothetical protein